jgi:hypothetical protein
VKCSDRGRDDRYVLFSAICWARFLMFLIAGYMKPICFFSSLLCCLLRETTGPGIRLFFSLQNTHDKLEKCVNTI